MKIETAIDQSLPRREYKLSMLRFMNISVILLCVTLIIIFILNPPPHLPTFFIVGIVIVVMVIQSIIYSQLKDDNVNGITLFNIVFISVMIFFGCYLSDGIYSSLTLLFALPLVLAITMLDTPSSIFIIVLQASGFTILLLAEITGLLIYDPSEDLVFRISMLIIVIVATSAILLYHMRTMYDAELKIIELHRKSERLQVHQKMTTDLAHDLRTPITVLTTSMYLIRKRYEKGMDISDKIDVLGKNVDQLNKMTQGFLELSKLDNLVHNNTITHAPVTLKNIIDMAINDYREIANIRNIDLSSEMYLKVPVVVMGDENLLKRVIDNLIMNGINYTGEGGFVRVILSAKDDKVVVQVEDNGIGISSDLHDKIFNRFYRVNEARTIQEGSGSGIGLSIVKRIVDLHQGTVHVDSSVDKGSTFTIQLPKSN